MSMSKEELLQGALTQLRAAVPELQGVLAASLDGLPLAHVLSGGVEPTRLAAMAATAVGLGRRISDTLNTGTFAEVSVNASSGQIFLYAAGTKAVLAVVAPAGANVGLINLEARDAAERLASALQQ